MKPYHPASAIRLFCLAGLMAIGTGLLSAQTAADPAASPAVAGIAATQAFSPIVAARLPSPLTLNINGNFNIPLGTDMSTTYDFGGSGDIGLAYRLPGLPLKLGGGLEYGLAPVLDKSTVSLTALRARIDLDLTIASFFGIYAFGAGGWYFSFSNADPNFNATNPYVAAGLGVSFALDSAIHLQVGAQYRNYLNGNAAHPSIYQALDAGVALDLALGDLGGAVTIPSMDLRPAFPVFYKYYDDHPVGSLVLKNDMNVPVTNMTAKVFIKQYMDSPKTVSVPGEIAAGASRTIELYALFTDKVLGVTEGTKVAAELSLQFNANGQTFSPSTVQTMSVMGRNAMTWDDNRKAAAYVTAKDPNVLNFARAITSFINSKESRMLNDNLVAAMAIHQALDLYGLNYTPNPITPYDQASQNKTAIDFLQFPKETFQYKAGDCSDLSILYAALFQAVGIDTAFITVPGHIFIAVDTRLSPAQAVKDLIPVSQLITKNNTAWIPIEITSRHEGFLAAWQLGAKEWAEGVSVGTAEFWPVAEAWKTYAPVGLSMGNDQPVAIPPLDAILLSYQKQMDTWVEQVLAPRISALQAKGPGDASALNQLGVLYAKYGMAAKAEAAFKSATAQKPQWLPSLLNLGHLYFMTEDWTKAAGIYKQATLLDPTNAQVLLALSRVNQELKNYEASQAQYKQVAALDPKLASQFAYLGGGSGTGTRAAAVADERMAIIWDTDIP